MIEANFGDILHMHVEPEGVYAMGAVCLPGSKVILVAIEDPDGAAFGLIALVWSDAEAAYRAKPSNKLVRVDPPLLVPAVVKKLISDDGIMELQDDIKLGAPVTVDMNSIHDLEWYSNLHPNQVWTRRSAVVHGPEGLLGLMPIEFFEIKTNA